MVASRLCSGGGHGAHALRPAGYIPNQRFAHCSKGLHSPVKSLDTIRRRRRWLLVACVAALAGMIAWSVLRPSPEERQAADFSQTMLHRESGEVTVEEREEMRRQWERFSPETRRQIFYTVARNNLARMRDESAKLTPAERAARVQDEIRKLRQRRERVSDPERQRLHEAVAEHPEAVREAVRTFMEFYSTELTARERAEFDPLVEEWFRMVEGRY